MRFLLTKLSHFFIFFLGLSVTAPFVPYRQPHFNNGKQKKGKDQDEEERDKFRLSPKHKGHEHEQDKLGF